MPTFYHVNTEDVTHTHPSPRSPGREKDRTRGDGVLDAVGEPLAPGDCDGGERGGGGSCLAWV